MALPYALREGLAGFRRATFAAVASISALAVALILIGMTAQLGWLFGGGLQDLRERAGEIEVFLDPLDEAGTARVRQRLADLPGADSLQYVSQAEATETFRETFGEGADLFDADALMPASFKVRFRGAFASPDSLDRAVARVQTWNQVEDVAFDPDLLQDIERNRTAIQRVGLGVGLLVVIAALLLVGNTIRLSIYARRMLIRTMKLVGATGAFIRRPFLVEGAIQGTLAGVVSGGVLWGLWSLLLREMEKADAFVGWPGGTPLATFGLCLVVGLALGLLASWVAVRRFIREVRLSA